jgi:hypothetical protein
MTTNRQSEELEIRRRFLQDFEFWARHCAKIRTKAGTIEPLVLNTVQKRFLASVLSQWRETGRVRLVVLKARQQGLSTVISAFQYWWLSQHKANKGLVMAHEADSTDALFQMYKRVHEHVPDWLRPSTKFSSKTELVFDQLDTGIRVATAGGRSIARGETLQTTHLSEVGFWPVAFASTNFNGLLQAVPNVDDTFVFVESTANGMTGKFKELWDGAVEGTNEFRPFFSGWFETPEYSEKAPDGFERTPDEETQASLYSLTDEQLQWRRQKIGTNGLDLFKQEYPATPDEAFLTTGRPVFLPDSLNERLAPINRKSPIKRMAVFNGKLEVHPVGELHVYVDYPVLDGAGKPTGERQLVSPADRYCIGADVGMGVRGGDFSVAQVLDSKKRQVAVWRGRIHPDAFATILTTLGYYYNTALIAPERNNHGLLTCVSLRDANYPLIYTDVGEGRLEDTDTILIGHLTTEKTKPFIINELRAADRDGTIKIYDEITLREMLTFVVTESGRLEAEQGKHDDTVMALAIANHIHEGSWEPIKVTDEYYAHAI